MAFRIRSANSGETELYLESDGEGGVSLYDSNGFTLITLQADGSFITHSAVTSPCYKTDTNGYVKVAKG